MLPTLRTFSEEIWKFNTRIWRSRAPDK